MRPPNPPARTLAITLPPTLSGFRAPGAGRAPSCGELPTGLPDRQNRARSETDHPIRDAPEEHAAHAGAPVSADDDQVGSLIAGQRHDLLIGKATTQTGPGLQAFGPGLFDQIVECRLDPGPRDVVGGVTRVHALTVPQGLREDMAHDQP